MPQIPGVADHAAPAPPWAARARKFLIGAAGFAAEIVASGLVHGQALVYLTAALGIASSFGIYKVANAKPAAP